MFYIKTLEFFFVFIFSCFYLFNWFNILFDCRNLKFLIIVGLRIPVLLKLFWQSAKCFHIFHNMLVILLMLPLNLAYATDGSWLRYTNNLTNFHDLMLLLCCNLDDRKISIKIFGQLCIIYIWFSIYTRVWCVSFCNFIYFYFRAFRCLQEWVIL